MCPCAPVAPHLQPRSEAEVAFACDDFMARAGWIVERYEQRRASHITEGLPDRRYVHMARGFRVWVELKKPGGQMTRQQHAWLGVELMAGALALPVDDVAQLLHLVNLLPKLYGHADALSYCRSVTALFAERGYRGERLPEGARKRRSGASKGSGQRQRTRRA
ncbi:hypothetical protein [Gemmatimonas sp. UBA7669]|uniref:hypothetical protein n=1 Tax=Gemmatimonas sp. UBA7669 TaxID=1946568 RepID=UPI0025BEDD5A|nr:hypothetical protein [Gemmatimonas sp. UBA7669]